MTKINKLYSRLPLVICCQFSCQHDNVVKLFGYSTGGPSRCIVYEFMSNGSLEDRLACRVCPLQIVLIFQLIKLIIIIIIINNNNNNNTIYKML